ncbi:MAG: DNA-directed RNA polymerase subunit omega [Candidatus Electryonea clarkiae]|nr:DNA-directed RNA polymerase subunit omega [Candidatus Electryonea clarkiae]MDP8287127.1 DNA-directed RNA polymerase subunit omega [Candidatus Electryonea clarkiae]
MGHEMFLAEDYIEKTRNIYEAVMIIAKRSRQIGESQRKEMDDYLSQLEMFEKFEQGEDDGMIEDTPIQHEPVLQFEKPTILALREMIGDKIDVEKEGDDWYDSDEESDDISKSTESFSGKLNLLGDVEEPGGGDEGA